MTLDEAIKRLEQHERWLESINAQEQAEAHLLGIEALKLVQKERRDLISYAGELLPGETEE